MKKRLIPIILSIFLIPLVSGFISPDEEMYSGGELATAVVGNNIFFGTLVAIGLVIIGCYIWAMMRKRKKRN